MPSDRNTIRVLLLDKANRDILDGLSHTTGKARSIFLSIIAVLCFALLGGFSVAGIHRKDASMASQLKAHGHHAEAVVIGKRTTSTGQGRDFCYLKYQFRSPESRAVAQVFTNEVMVPDTVFDHTAEGQSVGIAYDPNDPSRSTLDALVRSPMYPSWYVWCWWIGSAVILGWMCRSVLLQRRMGSQGKLIFGSIVGISCSGGTDDSPLEVRYTFCSPAGQMLERSSRAEVKATNFLQVSPRLTKDDSIAVLYVSDDLFMVL